LALNASGRKLSSVNVWSLAAAGYARIKSAPTSVRLVTAAVALLLAAGTVTTVTVLIVSRRTSTRFASYIASTSAEVPHFSHVVLIVMENKGFDQIIGNPDAPTINSLVWHYAFLTNYYAIAHPSEPNYLALASGSTQGILTDCTICAVNAPNLTDTLGAAGISWKLYAEDIPSPGFNGITFGLYARKHVPFLYFDDVLDNPSRRARIVSFGDWNNDLATGNLPRYSMVVPNLCNDMHSCPVRVGDAWLGRFLPPLLSSPEMKAGVVFIVFDEAQGPNASSHGGGRVAALVLGPLVRPGASSPQPLDHYSLLRTIEQSWGLPLLGDSATTAPISGIWAPFAL
jgi:phospholipase C